MPKDTPITPTKHRRGGRSPLSSMIRQAIDLMAQEGLTQSAAANKLGIDKSNLSRQLARHDAQALILQRKKELAESLDGLTENARRRAMVTAFELMQADQPPEIRARMVELFVRAKLIVAPVNVNLTLPGSTDVGGYTYRRPPQSGVVDITPNAASDTLSHGDD